LIVLPAMPAMPADAETPSLRLAALRAAWDESSWIEVIDTDLRGPDK
jgi:hypothetical protein